MLAFFEGEGDEGLEAFVEPFVIMLILVINAIVGVWQEHNAENALEALKEMQTTTTRVLRNGKIVPDVPSSELVPGDVVDVRVGDKVPADVRIMKFKTTTFKTDEGSLTGESETVLKHLDLVAKGVGFRKETAALLGYEAWAHFVIESRMAGTPETVGAHQVDVAIRLNSKALDRHPFLHQCGHQFFRQAFGILKPKLPNLTLLRFGRIEDRPTIFGHCPPYGRGQCKSRRGREGDPQTRGK